MQLFTHVRQWTRPGLAAAVLLLLPLMSDAAGPRGSIRGGRSGSSGNSFRGGTSSSSGGSIFNSRTPYRTPSYTPSFTRYRSPNYTPSYTPYRSPNYTPSYTPYRSPSYTPSYTPNYVNPNYGTSHEVAPNYLPSNTPTVTSSTPSVPANVVPEPTVTPTPPKNVVAKFAPPAQAKPNKVKSNAKFGLTWDLKKLIARDLDQALQTDQSQVQDDLSGYLMTQADKDALVAETQQHTHDPAKAAALAQAFAAK